MIVFSTIRQFVRAHPWKVSLVAIAAILYIAFNVWFYFFTKSGGLATNPVTTITEKIKSFGGLRESPSNPLGTSQSPTSPTPQRPTPPPTPTSRPTGPGAYACDPYGQCNLYSDEVRKQYCTVTFADPACLGACSDPAKRCKK